MIAYVIRRTLIGVVMLILMSFVTYALFFAAPINYARLACGKSCTQGQIAQVKVFLGYNKPWYEQWAEFGKGVVVGRDYPDSKEQREKAPQTVVHCSAPCLGYSPQNTVTINSEVKSSFPISLSLALIAFVLWMGGAILFGVIAALRQGSFIDRGIVGSFLVLYSFPTFFIGIFLLDYVSIKWGVYPAPNYVGFLTNPWQWLVNGFLPALTLAVSLMAGYMRMTRTFVLESFGEDYVRTARAKGLPQHRVVFKHALRAALTPLVTMAGLDMAVLVGGALITESVFNFDGLGHLANTSNQNNDLPTIVGLVLVLATLVIAANIVVDVLYAFIDPRVRLD